MKFLFAFFIAAVMFSSCIPSLKVRGDGDPIDHKEWTALVKKHVDEEGLVDYKGFIADTNKLNIYLKKLSDNAPAKRWTDNEEIAYWLNAYNAFTVKYIVDNYPVKSIKDLGAEKPIIFINTAWDQKFFSINGRKMDLNNIEQRILRQNFKEPRIHFALNCASMSCPKLRKEAFEANQLDKQLTDAAKVFLADNNRNKINEGKVSAIFDFYTQDFTKWTGKSLVDYINQFSATKLKEGQKIEYLEYDWSINEQGKKFQ